MHGSRAILFINIAAAAMFISATLYRFHFGVDFTDESQYIGQAMMLVNKGTAFVSDLFYQQTTSLILVPIFRLYIYFHGNSDGIFLLTRYVYFCLSLSGAAATFYLLRPHLPSSAYLLSLSPFLFIPFSIPSVSYNTVAMNLLAFSTLSTIFLIHGARHRWLGELTGFMLVTAAFVYPTILFVAGFSSGLLLIYRHDLMRRFCLSVLVGGALYGLLLLSLDPTIESLPDALRFTRGHGALKPLHEVLANAVRLLVPNKYFYAFPIFIYLLLSRRKFAFSIYLLGAVFVSLAYALKNAEGWTFNNSFVHALFSLTFWACLALSLFRQNGRPRMVSFASLALIFLGCLNFSYTSSNGLMNGVLGMLPILPYSIFMFSSRSPSLALFAASVCIGAILTSGNFMFVYRDANFWHLTQKTTGSPFSGIYTTPEKAIFLRKMDLVAKGMLRNKKVFSFYNFPAIYTWSDIFPQTNALYLFFACEDYNHNARLVPYIERLIATAHQADFIVLTGPQSFASKDYKYSCATDFTARVLDGTYTLLADVGEAQILSKIQ